MHSIVTKASMGDRQRIHCSALCSVSALGGLNITASPALLLNIFSSDLFPYREQWIGCSITDPPHLFPIQMNSVMDCRLQCLIDLVSFSSSQNTYTCTQTSTYNRHTHTHTFRNTRTPSTHPVFCQLVWRSKQPLVVDERNHFVPLLLQSKPSPTAVGTL